MYDWNVFWSAFCCAVIVLTAAVHPKAEAFIPAEMLLFDAEYDVQADLVIMLCCPKEPPIVTWVAECVPNSAMKRAYNPGLVLYGCVSD